MRIPGRKRQPAQQPADRGQFLIGTDLDELVGEPSDLPWISLVLRGASILTASGNLPQGQLLQDALAAGVVDAASAPRTYLEIGGGPPLNHSNTYALDHAGWRGAVVEPNPALSGEYRAVRSERLMFIGKGVSIDPTGTATFVSAGELSYVQGAGTPPDDMWSGAREEALASGDVHLIETIHPQRLWSDVVQQIGVPSFLSVDVEGAELSILGELTFDNGGPIVVCAEHSGDAARAAAMTQLMSSRGYARVLARASQWDGWFVRSDLALGVGN